MKYLKPLTSTTGHIFSVKEVTASNIVLVSDESDQEYFVMTLLDNRIMEKHDGYYAYVPYLGEIKQEDIDELNSANS
ncbi:hypothetical protein DQC29_21990 [Salmonella enterica subsp. enterica serovar Telelkebir]|nr:hypothetical protein [Salmonella enterica subsp. enterica serovar Telelkebir]